MDTNFLKTFITVCEYSGFSAAAHKLGYTQSTVSSQIKQLEKELGTTLFDRLYHRISLTSDGEAVLEYARQIISLEEQMALKVRRPEAIEGELRLAMASSISSRYFGVDFLKFQQLYPGIRLTITESGTEQMFDMLRKNEADLVFTLDSHIYDPEFEICAENMEETHFIAAADNPLASADELTLNDILGCPFALTEPGMSYRRMLDAMLAESSRSITPVLESGNPMQICSLVEKSSMISFLPDFITDELAETGRIVRLPVADVDIPVWTQLLVHRNKWHSPAIQAFTQFYKEVIGEQDPTPSA